jgi:hypothetical protein
MYYNIIIINIHSNFIHAGHRHHYTQHTYIIHHACVIHTHTRNAVGIWRGPEGSYIYIITQRLPRRAKVDPSGRKSFANTNTGRLGVVANARV